MTDPHDIDELASAHLDGTTSPEEAARVASDPDLRAAVAARAEELRAVARAIAEPPAVDATRRDAAIAAALAAFDEQAAPDRAGATVTPLAPRRGLSPRAVKALSAAAVVLLLALLVPLLANLDSDDETASFDATGAAIEGGSSTLDDDVAEEAGGQVNSPTEPSADGGAGDERLTYARLGTYDDVDDLAADLRAGTEDSAFTAGAASGGGDLDPPRCPVPESSANLLVGLAVVDGTPVEVQVEATPDGTRTLTVLATETCEVLGQREL